MKEQIRYLTIADIAKDLNVSHSLARREMLQKMNYLKIGAVYRVSIEEYQKYLKKCSAENND